MTAPFDKTQALVDDLLFAQHSLNTLHELLREGERHAPDAAEGTDSSGQVRVVLGPQGAPASIRVSAGWQRRLRPDSVGGSVVEAAQNAISKRTTAWTESLERSDWQRRMDRLERRMEHTLRTDDARLPPAFQRLRGGEEPRPLSLLTEEMLKMFDRIESFTVPEHAPESIGRNRTRRVSLSLAGGAAITGCKIDVAWAAGRSGSDLTAAIRDALEAALAAAVSHPASTSPVVGADGLIAETVALLESLPFNLR